jgi:hypothetical protein
MLCSRDASGARSAIPAARAGAMEVIALQKRAILPPRVGCGVWRWTGPEALSEVIRRHTRRGRTGTEDKVA